MLFPNSTNYTRRLVLERKYVPKEENEEDKKKNKTKKQKDEEKKESFSFTMPISTMGPLVDSLLKMGKIEAGPFTEQFSHLGNAM